MGIRETLNRNPAITTGATIVVIVVAIGFIIYNAVGSSGRPKIPKYAYFTTDDGKTWFKDDIKKVAPFKTDDGKEAVQVILYSCEDGKNPFVGYLSRMNPEAKKQSDEYRAQMAAKGPQNGPPNGPPGGPSGGPPDPRMYGMMQMSMEVKRPGDPAWISQRDMMRFQQLMVIKCPDGKNDNLVPVTAD